MSADRRPDVLGWLKGDAERIRTLVWDPEKVHVESSCWTWTGAMDRKGYPRLWVSGRSVLVRTAVYAVEYGRFAYGHVRVTCGNRACVRPMHFLEHGDQSAKAGLLVEALARKRMGGTYAEWRAVARETFWTRCRVQGTCWKFPLRLRVAGVAVRKEDFVLRVELGSSPWRTVVRTCGDAFCVRPAHLQVRTVEIPGGRGTAPVWDSEPISGTVELEAEVLDRGWVPAVL